MLVRLLSNVGLLVARRRVPVELVADRMPARLTDWEDFVPDGFTFQEGDTDATRWAAGRRALRAARHEFLSSLTVRPKGVSSFEWLTAHGLTWSDVGKDAAKSIGL